MNTAHQIFVIIRIVKQRRQFKKSLFLRHGSDNVDFWNYFSKYLLKKIKIWNWKLNSQNLPIDLAKENLTSYTYFDEYFYSGFVGFNACSENMQIRFAH